MATPRRDHLLKTALRLFNKYGFHATGIDKVQAESGVSKTTMYKYFKTKDELIQAVLEMRHQQFGDWFSSRSAEIAEESYPGLPQGRLLAMFDTLGEWINSENFFGCNFINASAEFSDFGHPIHRYAAEHKLDLAEYMRSFIPQMNQQDSEEFAKEILLLLDGAIVCAHTSGLKDSAERAKRMLMVLLESYQLEKTD